MCVCVGFCQEIEEERGGDEEGTSLLISLLRIACFPTTTPLIRDPLRKGRPLYKGHLLRHHANTLVYCFTSEIGTTSLQGTKLLAPKCPLFRGSTVYI